MLVLCLLYPSDNKGAKEAYNEASCEQTDHTLSICNNFVKSVDSLVLITH